MLVLMLVIFSGIDISLSISHRMAEGNRQYDPVIPDRAVYPHNIVTKSVQPEKTHHGVCCHHGSLYCIKRGTVCGEWYGAESVFA